LKILNKEGKTTTKAREETITSEEEEAEEEEVETTRGTKAEGRNTTQESRTYEHDF